MTNYEMIPLTPLQALAGQVSHRALSESAQMTLHREATADSLVAQRRLSSAYEGLPADPFVLQAVALTLKEHPWMNAHLVENELCQYRAVNIGVVMAREDGLIAPVVRDVAAKTTGELAVELRTLAAEAAAGRFDLQDMRSATFTLADLGPYGVDYFTPILPPGRVGILGIGRVRSICHATAEGCREGYVLPLSLTFDHRATDGVRAARFLASVAERLACTERL